MALLRTHIQGSRWMQRTPPGAQACWRTANLCYLTVQLCLKSGPGLLPATLAACSRMAKGKYLVPRAYGSSSSNSSSSMEDDGGVAASSTSTSTSTAGQQPLDKPLRVERLLANLGYGKRQECTAMVKRRRLVYAATGAPAKVGEKACAGDLLLDGEPLDPPTPLTIILHKPVGYVVTSPDDENVMDPKVYDLLPYRFGRRRPFLSSVGRLDKETSGLLLLTDEGKLLHSIQSPVRGIWKAYIAELASPLEGKEAAAAVRRFASGGLQLQGDRTPLLPAGLRMLGPTRAEVCICEGRYHQIRRMFAALGHQVVGLHRQAVGGLRLAAEEGDSSSSDSSSSRTVDSVGDVDLAEGDWRYATAAEIAAVLAGPDLQDSISQLQEGDSTDEAPAGEHQQRQQQEQIRQKQRRQDNRPMQQPDAISEMAVHSSSSTQKLEVLSSEDAAWYAAANASSSSSDRGGFQGTEDADEAEPELVTNRTWQNEQTRPEQTAVKRYRDSSRWARKRAAVARGVQTLRRQQQEQSGGRP